MSKVSSLPNNIGSISSGQWLTLRNAEGANFDTLYANDVWLDEEVQRACWHAFGAAILPGTVSSFVTGVGATAFTAKAGIIASVPQGTYGSQEKAVIVDLTADLTQGAVLSATNYVWLRRNPTTGVVDLVVNTSSSPGANCLLLATAVVGGSTISSITLERIPAKLEAKAIVVPLPNFASGAVKSAIIPMVTGYPVKILGAAIACETVVADSDGTCTVQLRKKPNGGSAVDCFASAIDAEGLTTLTPTAATLSATAANLQVAANDAVYAEMTCSSAGVDTQWTNACMTIWVQNLL